jgi:hypothetical protein
MKNLIFFFLLIYASFISCQKEDNLLSDNRYPTTIKPLEVNILKQKQQEFQDQNKDIASSLDEFGFCASSEATVNNPLPPLTTALTEIEAIEKAKKFILSNKNYLGIEEPDKVDITKAWFSTGYYNGGTMWRVDSHDQKYDTIQVLYSNISILIMNSEIHYCTGNWYPNIYIPKHFNFDQEKAKSTLRNKTVWHSDFIGQSHPMKITDQALASCQIAGLKIYPVKSDDKIQLFVTWKIHVPEVFYIFYIDVMTGEIIAEEPTIIS